MSEAKINLVAAVIGVGFLAAFVIGLAVSIGAVPFILIVAIVLAMALAEGFQSVRDALRRERDASGQS